MSASVGETRGEERRVVFHSKKQRFAALRKEGAAALGSKHDSVHLVPGAAAYDDGGTLEDPRRSGSLLRAELVRLSTLEKRKGYRERVHEPLWPTCQTLAEVLVHSKKICDILGSVYASEEAYVSSFSLASVLAREAGEALEEKGLDELVDGLVKAIDSPDPDTARAAFGTLSYVFRYCSTSLLRGAEETGWPHARKWYSGLLCGRSADSRTLGARAVASLVRRLGRKAVGKHVRRLLASLDAAASKRGQTSQESGVARLLFEICRGVGGRLHSRATPVFEHLFTTSKTTKRGESTERVALTLEKLVLEDARPGEEIDELWRVLATAAKTPSAATSRAIERLSVAVEWRSGRLLTSRGETDVAMPAEIASKRANDLADCLDALCRDGSKDDLLDATLRLARATARVADRSTAAREVLGGSVEQWLLKLVSRPRDRVRASETLADLGATSPALADAAFKAAIDLASVDARTALFVAAKTVGGGHPRKDADDATQLRDLVVATTTAASKQQDRPSLLAALAVASAALVPEDAVRAVAENTDHDPVVRSAALDALVDLGCSDIARNLVIESLFEWRRHEEGLPAAATLRCAADVLASADIADDEVSRSMVDALVAKAAVASERRRATLAIRLASRLEKDDSLAFVLDSFRQIHELPICLESERAYSKLVNGLEVLSRSPDLAQRTADALAVGGLELLFVKFEPLWALSKTLLDQLASSHPQVLWPRLLYRLRSVCEPSLTPTISEKSDPTPDTSALCRADALSESSGDRFAVLLAKSVEDDEEDRTSPVDPERAFDIVWDAARRCGILSGQPTSADAARVAVTLFLSFFKLDFARVFQDDPDAREVVTQILKDDDDAENAGKRPLLSRSTAYKRLETLLRVFSDARAPRSLPRCDDLQHVFERLLGKPRGHVAKLALGCLRPYKLPYLTPYANRLDSMLDDKTLRDTLVKMKVGSASSFTLVSEEDQKTDKWTVDDEHRADFAPLLCRLLFGRFRAKSSAVGGRRRGAPKARRATILSFIAGLDPENLDYFVYLMVRPFLNQCGATSSSPSLMLLQLRVAKDAERAVAAAKPSQVAGLLQLIRATAPRFGFKTEKHAPLFVSLALATIRSCGGGNDAGRREDLLNDAAVDEDEDDVIAEEEDDEDDEAPHNNRRQAKRTRALAVRCVTDLLDQYATGENIWKLEGGLSDRLWLCVGPHLRPLFDPDRHLDNEPVVVELIARVATTQPLKRLLNDDCVRACCIRAANRSRMALGAVCSLLLGDDTDEVDVAARMLLLPHSRTVVAALTAELESKKKNLASIFSSRATSSRTALDALCRIATYAKSNEWPLESDDASALASALSPRLLVVVDSGNGVDPTPMRKMMLDCLRTILPRVGHALRHVDEFVTLLSPPRPRKVATAFYSASDSLDARRAVAEACVVLLQTHPDLRDKSSLLRAAGLLAALAGVDQSGGKDSESKSSLEPDYELESAALSQLANVTSWSDDIFDADIKDIAAAPLVAHCVSTMRSGDPALRDAATRAVRSFVTAAFLPTTTSPVLERTLVPHILDSLDVADDATRRAHVVVLSAIVTVASQNEVTDDAFFADMRILQSPEDPEIDFFENIAHFQTHRRSKAFRRATAACARLSAVSVRRVLVPLSLQPLRDHRSTEALRADAASCLGAAASRLPWSRYASLFKGLCARLKAQQQGTASNESSAANPTQLFSEQSSNKKRKGNRQDAEERKNAPKSLEAASVTAICATLDAFSFDFSEENDAEDKVLTGVMQWMLPSARYLMNKPVRNKKTGAREEILRSPIALSLSRFASKLPASHRAQETRALVVAVCAALRNRDATQRDMGRATLAKMVRTHLAAASKTEAGDDNVVQIVLGELESALKSGGYMLAVRSAAVHSILSTLGAVCTSGPLNEDDKSTNNPRACVNVAIVKIAHLLVDDLLGQAATARETHESGDHKAGSAAGVPEAKKLVTRTYDSFELAARALAWTSDAVRDLLDPVVSALRERASEIDDRQAAEAARCRTALARIATGLASNESATADGILRQTVDMLRDGLGLSGDEPMVTEEDDDDDDEDEDEQLPVFDDATAVVARKKRRIVGKVVTWMPSHEGTSADGAEARRRKKEGERENVRVLDGAQAPKLTGRQKGANEERAEGDADATIRAESIRASILMLRHAIKKRGGVLFDKKTMRDPEAPAHRAAVPLPELMAKVYKKRAVADDQLQLDIVHIASALLAWQLETAHLWARRLAKIALAALSRSAKNGMFLGADAVQASFKMLATLISHQKRGTFSEDSSDDEEETGFYAITLADRQLKAVVSSVHVALSSSRDEGSFVSHRASTYALLKALVQRPVVVSEIYDCMNTIAEVRVTSLDASERRRASSIFLNFLMNYQMGKKRRKHHMSQLVEGLEYEYVEGRLAAVESLGSALRVLPAALVDEHSEAFFAALALRVANEDERDCASKVADTLVTFLRRLPDPSFRKFVDRASTWLEAAVDGDDEEKLRRLRLLGVRCVEGLFRSNAAYLAARPDLVETLLKKLVAVMPLATGDVFAAYVGGASRFLSALPVPGERALSRGVRLVPLVVDSLALPGTRLDASRFIGSYLSRRTPVRLRVTVGSGEGGCEYLEDDKESLTKIAKASIVHLDVNEADTFDQELGLQSSKNLLFATAALNQRKDDDSVAWIFDRVSSMSCRRGEPRRRAVFAWFAAVAVDEHLGSSVIVRHLDRVVAPLHRAIEDEEREERQGRTYHSKRSSTDNSAAGMAHDLMRRFEDVVGAPAMASAVANVAAALKLKRADRKQKRIREAVTDPEAAARRKLERNRDKRRKTTGSKRGGRGGGVTLASDLLGY